VTYILSADWHLHLWSQFATVDEETGNSRLSGMLSEVDRMVMAAEQQGIGEIFVAGDVFHVRGSLHPVVLNALLDRFRTYKEDYPSVLFAIMPGNHDLEGREVTELGSAVRSLDACENVLVCSDIGEIHWASKVATIPWVSTRAGIIQRIEDVGDRITKSGHFLKDFDLHLHVGMSDVISGVPGHFTAKELDAFGFKRVFAGHYHNYKSFDDKVFSIGALTHQTWSDVDSKAGFLIVGDEVEHIASTAPRFVDMMSAKDADIPGNYIRARDISLTETEIKELRDGFLKAGAKGVIIQAAKKGKATTRPATAPKGASLEVVVSNYGKMKSISPEVIKEALEILWEAKYH
jgi:DNA repair exonuclease SbcCD nuclease subunit